ncbi:site-specific integrase [Salmonella enterica]|uniref:tyrosine-type recombinase/integrase n=1 Tax=Salmonella enterica TaxID=28901 RepID=UPI0029323387|nr:site-specific integrase [Salmonella enterica]EEP0970350.1 site-specific integrase [Salmonella enterica]MDV2062585.1 site-specific integrase [Salmonella enterica]
MVIGINSFLLDSGERYCLIVNKENGQPLYYSNLYLTTQIRNRGYSISTIESIAVNIALFYRFLNERNISIEDDFLEHKYLSNEDIDRLAIFMSQKFLLKKKKNKKQYASKYTLSRRLSNIAGYLFWLASILIKSHNQTNLALKMVNAIKARRPRNNQKFNNWEEDEECINELAINRIMELIDPNSKENPYLPYVRERNQLLIIMLYELGIRCGELLNVRISDIDFRKNRLRIERRADEKSDPRIKQPLVKTLDRTLPLSKYLIGKLYNYIFNRRSLAMGKSDYLFVSCKPGSNQGNPLSISGYHKVISQLAMSDPLLKGLKGHQFRHTWNYNFSKLMDSQNPKISEREQEIMREYLMGWKRGSGTAAVYNKRFIKEKANEASVKLQEQLNVNRRNKYDTKSNT